jgi:hypothetical protein
MSHLITKRTQPLPIMVVAIPHMLEGFQCDFFTCNWGFATGPNADMKRQFTTPYLEQVVSVHRARNIAFLAARIKDEANKCWYHTRHKTAEEILCLAKNTNDLESVGQGVKRLRWCHDLLDNPKRHASEQTISLCVDLGREIYKYFRSEPEYILNLKTLC